MKTGEIWKVKTYNKVTTKEQIICIHVINISESNENHQPQ
jgi:hypothetical protein